MSGLSNSVPNPQARVNLQAKTLLGVLLTEFTDVPACTFQTLLSKIKENNIPLPQDPYTIDELVMELHDLGQILAIKSVSTTGDYWIIINMSVLTTEVHNKLFSHSAKV